MTSIPFSNLLTIIYVLVDDWYKTAEKHISKCKVGRKSSFSNSEVLTLMIAHDFIPYPSETQYIEHMRANYLDMFPRLISQSQFNRRARSLRFPVEEFRRYWLKKKGILSNTCYLLDTKPIPVVGYRRN